MVGATRVGCAMAVSLLQPPATSMMSSNGRSVLRLGYTGAVLEVEGQRGLGSAWWGLQQSNGELGRRLGFQYLWIKIRHRTSTIYRAFYTKS
jgi:hypothetical protein